MGVQCINECAYFQTITTVSAMKESNLGAIVFQKNDCRKDFSAIYPQISGITLTCHPNRLPKFGNETYPFVVDWQMPNLEQNKQGEIINQR